MTTEARIELPPPNLPVLVVLLTDDFIGETKEPLRWMVAKDHPFVPGMTVVRMYVATGGVEIYSSSGDGRSCMRDTVPNGRVRLIQEAMSVQVFIEEIEAAESENDDDEDDPDDNSPENTNPEPESTSSAATS